MSFELKTGESVGEGVVRNVRHQIEKALEHLGAAADPHARGASETEAVGEVRKCFKRIRAALRLVRQQLGDDRYHEENYCFRDAARPLTQVRDAGILLETVEKLRRQFPKATSSGTFSTIRKALLAAHDEVCQRVLQRDRALTEVRDFAAHALARIPDWQLAAGGPEALESGIRRVYRAAHRALAVAAQSSTVANLHEWRKQTKYLWHVLQLVEPALTGAEKELVDKTHRLSTLLGEDHDLAVLRQTLAADPLPYGGHANLKALFVLIDRRRADLEREAFTLGRDIYGLSPGVFMGRIAASMRRENSNEECQQAQ